MRPLTGRFYGIVFRAEPWDSHYPTKFQARRGVMLHAVNQGWTRTDCLDAFRGHELWCAGTDGRPLGRIETVKRITRDHDAASKRRKAEPAYTDATDVRQFIGELKALAATWPWRGQAGRTDRETIGHAHQIGTGLGRDVIDLSVREVADKTGIVPATASRSLRRLTRDGWLKKISNPDSQPGHAARYRLTRPEPKDSPTTEHTYLLLSGEECMFHLVLALNDLDRSCSLIFPTGGGG